MAGRISARAQAILDEMEREAAARRGGQEPSGDVAPPAASSAATPFDPPPPPAAAAVDQDDELLDLVEQVVDQTERARLRLTALSEAIDDLVGRVGPATQEPGTEAGGSTSALDAQTDVPAGPGDPGGRRT